MTSKKRAKLSLRCYCCGIPIIGEGVSLVAAGDGTDREVDRVFVMLPEHADKVEGIYLNAWLDRPKEKRRG